MILEAAILFICVQISLIVGFLMGRSRIIQGSNQVAKGATINSFLEQPSSQDLPKSSVKIDNSTFVTSTEDKQLTGMGKVIGNQTEIVDDVSSSVSKLAQLKRNK